MVYLRRFFFLFSALFGQIFIKVHTKVGKFKSIKLIKKIFDKQYNLFFKFYCDNSNSIGFETELICYVNRQQTNFV